MSGFLKLDCGIMESSLWKQRDARSLFITAMLMAEPIVLETAMDQLEVRDLKPTGWSVPPGRYGFVRASGKALIDRDGLTEEKGMRALEALCAPDRDSRSSAFEGRRLARVDEGYIVLNHARFRDKEYLGAERARRYRQRKREEAALVASRDGRDADVTQRDAYASASASASGSASRTTNQEDSFQGERPGVKKLDEFMARWPFGRFADLVTGYLRASRSSIAVIQTFEMHLTGEMSHEPATPEQLGLALQQYMPQEQDGQFKAIFFAGVLRKVKLMPERAERRRMNSAEDAHLAEERRQAEERAQDERDQQMLAAFAGTNEARFAQLRATAERAIPTQSVRAETREIMVHTELVRLVRKETQ